MDHNAVKFVGIGFPNLRRVVGHTLGRNEQVAGYEGELCIGKRHDIGEGIVLEVLQVDRVEVFVGTKDVVQLTELSAVERNDVRDPVRK